MHTYSAIPATAIVAGTTTIDGKFDECMYLCRYILDQVFGMAELGDLHLASLFCFVIGGLSFVSDLARRTVAMTSLVRLCNPFEQPFTGCVARPEDTLGLLVPQFSACSKSSTRLSMTA